MLARLLKLQLKLGVYTLVGLAVIALLPGLPPHQEFEAYTVTPAKNVDAGKRVNVFDKAEAVIDGGVMGAESILPIGKGEAFYSGTKTGQVIKYENGKVKVIAQTGQPCDGLWELPKCGRPLGMRLEASGKLVLADAFYGLLRLDPESGQMESLFNYSQEIGGKVPLFADDLDIDKAGNIYWSDASSNYNYQYQALDYLSSVPSGRLIKFNPKTKKNAVLIPDLHFANGVQLSPSEDFVLICETVRSRVHRYYLKGAKAGRHDLFADGLPGWPDNIRSNGKGGYYVALVVPRQELADILGPIPIVRKLASRLVLLFDFAVDLLRELLPKSSILGNLKVYILHLGPIGKPSRQPSRILELDGKGKVIRILEGDKNPIPGVTQLSVSEKYAYLGNFVSSQVWRIDAAALN